MPPEWSSSLRSRWRDTVALELVIVHNYKHRYTYTNIFLVEGALYYEKDTKLSEPNALNTYVSKQAVLYFTCTL